jgi:mono/diheme cytochrome c family protein
MKRRFAISIVILVLLGAAVIVVAWPRAERIPAHAPYAWAATPANIARGAYLARAGDCAACHTARGGIAYAGGRAFETPFGTLYAPNITPDTHTGLGAWSADDFWQALHNGIARDGRLLYPAFPYTHYTRMPRADADVLYAFLRSLAPARQPNRAHALRFPYNLHIVLAGWRLLYFRPGVYVPQPARSPEWNRGAYLVEGPGHCGACHSARNGLGASSAALSGGLITTLGWYAPALTSSREAGLGDWDTAHIVQLLRTGVAPRGAVFGPMADVVAHSLQYLSQDDVGAMAIYLKSLPATPGPAPVSGTIVPSEDALAPGRRLYAHHCAACHGVDGRGKTASGRPAYPPLAGNRALTMADPVNAIRIVLNGGFAPATAGNPRPFGMPPFSPLLDDAQTAAVVTYVRNSWGNTGSAVTPAQVNRYRAVPLD